MNIYKVTLVIVSVLLICAITEAKKKNKQKSSRTKTKTKWSTSSDLGPNGAQALVATEEHGYYVKRTFLPYNVTASGETPLLRSPPYLGIPIVWFECVDAACARGNSGAINGNSNAISDGFLCDDDCAEAYEPVCGKTPSELAVFYNQCKLNVAKCRTHGLWQDVAYEECKKSYPKQVQYADNKFKSSPFFKENKMVLTTKSGNDASKDESILEVALDALSKIEEKIAVGASVTTQDGDSETDNATEATTVQNLITLK